jgi:hypothetical protein
MEGTIMSTVEKAGNGGQFIDAYDVTLTGVADDLVREELRRLSRFETSDERTYRLSHRDLAQIRLALAERLGEHHAHSAGALWTERHVYVCTPTGGSSFLAATSE